MKYRITTNGKTYRVEKKVLWSWKVVKRPGHCAEGHEIEYFDTYHVAFESVLAAHGSLNAEFATNWERIPNVISEIEIKHDERCDKVLQDSNNTRRFVSDVNADVREYIKKTAYLNKLVESFRFEIDNLTRELHKKADKEQEV